MKILAAGDIHGVMSVYEWLALVTAEQQVGIVLLAGDLTASSVDEEEQRDEAQRLISILKRFPVPTLYLMGNDDFFSLAYEDELVKPLHGRRFEFGEYNFVGYQYSTPFVGSIHEKTEQEIEMECTCNPLSRPRISRLHLFWRARGELVAGCPP
jgi:Icc-related predicted phosphoesterase